MIKIFMLLAVFATAGIFGAAAGRMHQEWPYNYQNTEAENSPKPGENLILHVDVERTKECANKFYREIYDGHKTRVHQHSWQQGAKPVGAESYNILIEIPKNAQPGAARYCFAQEPECNWVQYALPNWTKMKCYPFTIAKAN